MRRLSQLFLLLVLLVTACGRQDTPAPRVEVGPAPVSSTPGSVSSVLDYPTGQLPQASPQERFDAALIEALNLLADHKLVEALQAVKAAQQIQDSEQVRHLSERISRAIAEQAAAEKVALDLRGALDAGKADDAARLATGALQQYGGGEAAPELVRIKQQADALVLATATDKDNQCRRLQSDAQAAVRDNNLRAAALCLEQAAQLREDPTLRQQLAQVNGRLSRYEECRQRAQTLRRDSSRLEDALAALREAAEAWDTLQVRQEIDDYTLALQRRRERLGVVEFTTENDLGLPGVGRLVADELLPAFKTRFDLVERGHVGQVLQELKLEGADLASASQAGAEVSRLAGVRFLVVGSLSPLNGITAHARLVEVRTGLIAQTARVSAPNLDQLLKRLPLLAQVLQMSDEQKMAFELAEAQRAPEVRPIEVVTAVPPPPVIVVDQPPPPALVTFSLRPPALGGLTVVEFNALPPVVVAPPPPPPAQLVIVREEPRRRLLSLSLEIGDNLFRRGHHREAQRHFELALSLTSDRAAIDLRIERCRALTPPVASAPVVVAPQPIVVVAPPPSRPRMVVFNFLLNCQPGLVPPACGDWAADHFAARFGASYEVVDRGEVCWYMGRLGITMRDVLVDPSSRLALAQAMNVRCFLYGAIEQTASLNVTTHLIDAQTGARTGTGMIHVQDQEEMKLRMDELAHQVGAAPAEQTRLAQQGKQKEAAINEARTLIKGGNFTRAAAVAKDALKNNPRDVALQSLEQEAEQKARQAALAETQRKAAEARKAEAAAADLRRRELARQAEAARAQAQAQAKAAGEAARQEQARRRTLACEQLRAQAHAAQQRGNYDQAVQALQSALALQQSDALKQELTQVRVEQERVARAKAEQKELADRAARQKAEAAAQARLAAERQQRDAAEAEKRRIQQASDQARQAALLKQAQQQIAQKQYDPAIHTLLAARQLAATPETDRLLQQARDNLAVEEAARKSQATRAEAERKLAAEKAQRDQAATALRQKQTQYQTLVDAAQRSVAAHQYDDAIARYHEAQKLFATDAVVNGLKQAEAQRDRERADGAAQERKRLEQQQAARVALPPKTPAASPPPVPNSQSRYNEAMQTAAALDKKGRFAEAQAAYRAALQAVPKDARATAGLQKAEFNTHLAEGQKLLNARKYAEAAREFELAVNLDPRNNEAKVLLQKARSGKQ
jgi:tetratricopeptide (TPR) repeat protein